MASTTKSLQSTDIFSVSYHQFRTGFLVYCSIIICKFILIINRYQNYHYVRKCKNNYFMERRRIKRKCQFRVKILGKFGSFVVGFSPIFTEHVLGSMRPLLRAKYFSICAEIRRRGSWYNDHKYSIGWFR